MTHNVFARIVLKTDGGSRSYLQISMCVCFEYQVDLVECLTLLCGELCDTSEALYSAVCRKRLVTLKVC